MYTEICWCIAIDFFDEFGPKSPTEPEKPLMEMNSEEYQDHKKRLDKEKSLIKKGYTPGLHVNASFFYHG